MTFQGGDFYPPPELTWLNSFDTICVIAESICGVLIASLAARLCFHKFLFACRSRICFSTFVSFLILEFEKSIQFESVFIFETVIGIQGLSLDSTHTEPYTHRLSFLGNTLSLSSLPQHFSTTYSGKGGFAVSFYVLLMKRNSLRQPKCQLVAGFASCCVGRACSWCMDSWSITLVLEFILVSIGQQLPTASSTGSDNKSLLPLRISVPANTNVQV